MRKVTRVYDSEVDGVTMATVTFGSSPTTYEIPHYVLNVVPEGLEVSKDQHMWWCKFTRRTYELPLEYSQYIEQSWYGRLVEEWHDLGERLHKLEHYLALPDIHHEDLLRRQQSAMREYLKVLTERITLCTKHSTITQ